MMMEELGIISGMDMTFECTVVKLMWALKQAKTQKKLKEIMEKNLVGEFSMD